MSTGKNVFIVGPGFIGWNIIDLLVKENYTVTGLVRRKEHADGIKASGATPVMGDLNDETLIKNETAKNDIVFHTATADHLPSARAVLAGVRERASKGLQTIYIHTSGTSVLDDNAQGEFKSDKIYRDDQPETVDAVADNAPHREIDLAIKNFHLEYQNNAPEGHGKPKIAIMTPPLIYGFNPAHKRLSIQIPILTQFAIKHGYSGHMGKGLAVESNIHVLDLARGYVVLLHHLEKTPAGPDTSNIYWFCETTGDNEPSWKEVATVIGEALYSAGKISDPTPKEIPESLYGDVFGESTGPVLGLNSRSRAIRLRELGWKPVEKDWKTSYVEDEFPQILANIKEDFAGYTGPVLTK